MLNLKDKISVLVAHTETDEVIKHFYQQATNAVTTRILKQEPGYAERFTYTSNIHGDSSTDQVSLELHGEITSVVRETGTEGTVEKCSRISPENRSLAVNSDSLEFRDKFNPAYYVTHSSYSDDDTNDTKPRIYILPIPYKTSTDSQVAIITQIMYQVDSFDLDDTYVGIYSGSSDHWVYPSQFHHLLELYVAIKILNRKIIQMATVEEEQELVDILTAAKRTYEDEYNTFFAVIERKQEQQEGAREG